MARKTKSNSSSNKHTSSSSSSGPTDAQISATILALTDKRGTTKTICPSEVPRLLCPSTWRAYMPRVRAVAIRLAKEGRIDITQKGQVVVVETEEDIQGPIRLRLRKQEGMEIRKQEGMEETELKDRIEKGGTNSKRDSPAAPIEHFVDRIK
ncbi:hypothetical protein VYU27_008910 [Nannochloropsis oceanica]